MVTEDSIKERLGQTETFLSNFEQKNISQEPRAKGMGLDTTRHDETSVHVCVVGSISSY